MHRRAYDATGDRHRTVWSLINQTRSWGHVDLAAYRDACDRRTECHALYRFELGKWTWLVGLFSPELGKGISRHKAAGGDLKKVTDLIATAQARLEQQGRSVRIMSICEAGYEGAWLYRALLAAGVAKCRFWRLVSHRPMPLYRGYEIMVTARGRTGDEVMRRLAQQRTEATRKA